MNTKNNIALFCFVFLLVILIGLSGCSMAEPAIYSTPVYTTVNMTGLTLDTLGITVTAEELNFVDGVTSALQAQLNGKASTSDLALKANLASPTFTGVVTLPVTTLSGNISVNNYIYDNSMGNTDIPFVVPSGWGISVKGYNSTSGVRILYFSDNINPQNNDTIGRFTYRGRDSAGDMCDYGYFCCGIADKTNGSEDGLFYWYLVQNGVDNYVMYLTSAGELFVDVGTTVFDDLDDIKELKKAFVDKDFSALIEKGIAVSKTGSDNTTDVMISQQKIISLLAGGIYQLSDRVDKLESRIKVLEGKLK